MLASWVLSTVARHDLTTSHTLALKAEALANETPAATGEEAPNPVAAMPGGGRPLPRPEQTATAALAEAGVRLRTLLDAAEQEMLAQRTAALPTLEAAEAALQDLNKHAITELKGLSNPPAGVKLVLEALCILFQVIVNTASITASFSTTACSFHCHHPALPFAVLPTRPNAPTLPPPRDRSSPSGSWHPTDAPS